LAATDASRNVVLLVTELREEMASPVVHFVILVAVQAIGVLLLMSVHVSAYAMKNTFTWIYDVFFIRNATFLIK